MEFEWDENKAAANLSKHGVAFDEAKLSLKMHFMLISTIPTTLMMSIGILSLDNQSSVVC